MNDSTEDDPPPLEFWRHVFEEIHRYTMPVIVKPLGPWPMVDVRSATVTIVDTPQRLLGITCWHVIEEARKCARDHGRYTCQIDERQFDIVGHLIDEDEEADLATVALEEADLRENRSTPYLWHQDAPAPEPGDAVVTLGYPGDSKRYSAAGQMDIAFVSCLGTVQTVEADQFSIRYDRSRWMHLPGAIAPEDLTWGGFSGAGGFLVRWTGLAVTIDLVGIAIEAHDAWDKFYYARADRIRPDGTIIRSRRRSPP